MARIIGEHDSQKPNGAAIPFLELDELQQSEATLATVKMGAWLLAEGFTPIDELFQRDYLVELADGTKTVTRYEVFIGEREE